MGSASNFKTKAFSGMIWKFAERISAQLVSVIVSVILARMLMPEDYSVVSIVAIFFCFCNVFISGGLNTALIQKKDSDIIDYSSVLFVSLGVATLVYVAMFFLAPIIANIYEKQLLIPVIRVLSITFFVNAYKAVLCAKVSSDLRFKNFFISTIIGTVISGIIGICMAFKGFGAWALVAQQMSNSIIDTLILTITTKVKFKFIISLSRLKGLLNYGWKIFVSSIIDVTYNEIRPLIVGVKFSGVDLAFYNKGKTFPQMLNSSICESIAAVLFPVISKFQEDKDKVLNITRRYMSVSSYIISPLLIGFFAISDNFVGVILSEKWLPISPYIRIFCINYFFNIVQTGNLQAIRAIGRSDIILKLEIIKKTLYFLVIVIFVIFSKTPYMIAVSTMVCTLIATVVNSYPNRKLIGYGYRKQLMDLLPNMLQAIIMGVIVNFVGYIKAPQFLVMVLQILTGIVIYIGLSILGRNDNFSYLLNVIKQKGGK